MVEFILASSSKQRQNILKMIGLKYDVLISDDEEYSMEKETDKYVEELSFNKAKAVRKKINDKKIVVAADTIIYCNNKIYEKPKTKEEAFTYLKELSGNKNSCYTGITIIDLYKNKTISLSSKVDIYFKNITDDEARWYVDNEKKVFERCGYVPLGKAAIFIDRIDGDYNTLFGISPSILFEMLKELGYNINDFEFERCDMYNESNNN